MQKLPLLLILTIFLASCQPQERSTQRELSLWYNQPAQTWTEALPVGNGRLGAMVFGGTETERIQLNEESLWTGGAIDRANPEALKYLDEVRQLLFDGEYAEAEKLAQEKIMALRLERAHTYQTLGDLYLEFNGSDDVSEYRRSLDLREAMTSVEYIKDGVRFKREIFSSAPDNSIVLIMSSDEPGSINFTAWMNRPGEAETVSAENNRIKMTGFAEDDGRGTHFASIVDINTTGGEVITGDT
ncbi:MAG: glycoside hydrolase family 95 protein, partial [Bacteroidales bacterium]